MDNLDFSKLFERIECVKSDTHYWLVRSMGGDYFHEFVTRGFVGIGYNEVALTEIKYATSFGKNATDCLRDLIDQNEAIKHSLTSGDGELNSKYAATQLLKFYRDIKVGDIIVIPGHRSGRVVIARVESDVYEDQEVSKLAGVCNFIKRRKICVLKKTMRRLLNPKLQLMFNSRHIISNADDYAEYIDSCISDFYQKEGCTSLVLRVKEKNDLRAADFGLVPDLIELVQDFSDEYGLNIDTDSIKTKICVQSPGDILMFAYENWDAMALVGLILVTLMGGEFKWNKEGLKISTPGLSAIINAISDFLDRRRQRIERKRILEKIDRMQIESPKDLLNALFPKEDQDADNNKPSLKG